MAQLEVIALDTATPQLRAPGGSDTYLMPKDLTVQSTVNATNVEVTNVKAKDGTAAITISDTSGNVGLSANLNFSGTGQRITGDMSNATAASRLFLQSSTTNGNTNFGIIPNGTGTISLLQVYSASDPENSSFLDLRCDSAADSRIRSGITGTGTYLPMTFYTGGSERMRLDTSGNFGIGTTSPSTNLDVGGGSGAVSVRINGGASGTGNGANIYLSNNGSVVGTLGNPSVPYNTAFDNLIALTGYYGLRFDTNGSERMRIDSSGRLSQGGSGTSANYSFIQDKTVTGATTVIGFGAQGVVQSDVTSVHAAFRSNATTAAASFTLNSLYHFQAGQPTLGAGSTVTNQMGFIAGSTLTGATNNFGFYSDIASGSNRWNFYAAGTADNYFAGNVYIATTSAQNNSRLRVVGSSTSGSNYTLLVEGSGGADNFYVRDDGEMYSLPTYNRTSASASNVGVDAAGGFFRSTSSLRYKTNVVDAAHGLAEVLKLRSVTYKGINDGDKIFGGLIAEEVHDAGLTEFVAYDNEGRPDALHYGNMVALLVKAMQEQQEQIKALQDKIVALEAR